MTDLNSGDYMQADCEVVSSFCESLADTKRFRDVSLSGQTGECVSIISAQTGECVSIISGQTGECVSIISAQTGDSLHILPSITDNWSITLDTDHTKLILHSMCLLGHLILVLFD